MNSADQLDFHTSISHSQYANNMLVFLGGFIINFFWIPTALANPTVQQIFDYLSSVDFGIHVIRSVTGGFIALAFKLYYDYRKAKRAKTHSNQATKVPGGPDL